MLGLGSSLISSGAVSESPRVLIASYNFNDDTGSGTGSSNATIPSGWATGMGAAHTVFGSTTTKNATGPAIGFTFTSATTPSTNTGAGGGHVGGPDTLGTVVTDGTWDGGTDHRYMMYLSLIHI